jgi:peptidoglycan hydrolase-like protein with peptidoglycan-binding domain
MGTLPNEFKTPNLPKANMIRSNLFFLTVFFLGNIAHAQKSGGLPPLTVTPPSLPSMAIVPTAPAPDKLVQETQAALNQKGFNAGPADGFIGPLTESAIRQAQAKLGLSPTGQPSDDLLGSIRRFTDLPAKTSDTQLTCNTLTSRQISGQVSEHLSKYSSSRTNFFTQTSSGETLANPTVTLSIKIFYDASTVFADIVRTSGNKEFDKAVQNAVETTIKCSSNAPDQPRIHLVYSLF